MRLPKTSALLLFLVALVCGAGLVLLLPTDMVPGALFTAFAVCIGFCWFVVYEGKALKPGLWALLGHFDSLVVTKPSRARLGFFASAAFAAGTLVGFLVVLVRAAQ